jgi:serine/threonine protein kinase
MTDVGCSQHSINFIDQLLQFDPMRRSSLAESLGHPWLYPRFWPSGVPSYMQPEEEQSGRKRSGSFAGSVMSAPAGTPMTGVSEEFQALDLEYDSSAESPAMVDFDDASLGGPSDMSRSQELRAQLEQREQSWDILNDEMGDPEQTPLARPRNNLPPEEHTPRPRPPIITNVQELPGPARPKRKLDSADDLVTPGGAGNKGLGARKASKASQFDSPATATRQKFPNGALNDRKTSLRNKGKAPVVRDFADSDE